MQTTKKKPSLIFILFGAVLSGYLGYLIGGAWQEGMTLKEFMEAWGVVCASPFGDYFNRCCNRNLCNRCHPVLHKPEELYAGEGVWHSTF